ncbi:MAG: hypothetical protein HY821_21555 [Acidobacteria bacterium]|nr:hypothetical protein [Acidobacteriota bacterium]
METTTVFRGALRQMMERPLPGPVAGALDRLLRLEALDTMCDTVRRRRGAPFAEQLLAELGVTVQVEERDVEKIPKSGPVVVVANHPHGMVEAAVLALLLRRVRGDARILANQILGQLPELAGEMIAVDPFAKGKNARAVRRAVEGLDGGGWRIRSGRIRRRGWRGRPGRG